MKQVEVLRYDAFSKAADKGNPAGIVLEGSHLTDEEMQKIAEKAGYNETSFYCQASRLTFASVILRQGMK